MKKIIIIGASGHGKVVADIARLNEYKKISFLDDNEEIKECEGYPVLGKTEEFVQYNCDFIVAIGNANVRKTIQEKLEAAGKHIATLIHPDAVMGDKVSLGQGSVVMAGTIINSPSKIGKGCIINTSASVDHDCCLCDYVHVSVGAHLAGTVYIGEQSWIGIGACISNNLSVCDRCLIGAGAVVVRSINESGTYIGVPAEKVKK